MIDTRKWQVSQPQASAALTPQEVTLALISVLGRVSPRIVVRPETLNKWKSQ